MRERRSRTNARIPSGLNLSAFATLPPHRARRGWWASGYVSHQHQISFVMRHHGPVALVRALALYVGSADHWYFRRGPLAMSNRGNFRNVVGITLAVVLSVCWGFQDDLKALVTSSVSVSPARRGITIMSAGANDAQKRSEGRADFDLALKGDAKDPLALFGLGWVEQLDGNRDRASALYDGAITELQDLLHAARFNQSLVLEEKGDLRGAYEQVRLLLRVDPQHEKARARQEDLIRKMGSQNN